MGSIAARWGQKLKTQPLAPGTLREGMIQAILKCEFLIETCLGIREIDQEPNVMAGEKLIVVTFRDEFQAQDAIRELRRVGFREDQLVIAMSERRDRKGLIKNALRKLGAATETWSVCEQLFADGQAVIGLRSQARSAEASEIMQRYGGEMQYDGDAERGA